jgi:hypothetical protein
MQLDLRSSHFDIAVDDFGSNPMMSVSIGTKIPPPPTPPTLPNAAPKKPISDPSTICHPNFKTRHVAAFSYPGSYFFGFFSDKNEQSHLNTDISLTSRQFQNGKENEHINYTCLQQNKHACLDAWHPAHEVLSLISQFSIKRSHPN